MNVIVAFIVAILTTPAWAASIDPSDIRVIDGDTIRIHRAKPDVRLVGFNAPETRRAQCAAERAVGDRATRRLRELVRSGDLDLRIRIGTARVEIRYAAPSSIVQHWCACWDLVPAKFRQKVEPTAS